MAHLLRLAVLLLLGWITPSHALVPMVLNYYTASTQNAGQKHSTAAAACVADAAIKTSVNESYSYTFVRISNPDPDTAICRNEIKNKQDGSVVAADSGNELVRSSGSSCPANSNAVNQTQCQCNTGSVEQGSSCGAVAKTCEVGGTYSAGSSRPLGTGSAMPAAGVSALFQPTPSCSGGCGVTGSSLRAERGLDGNTWTLVVPLLIYTGGSCTESQKDLEINTKWDDAKKDDLAPSSCPAGKCPGTINGVSVCANCSASATTSTSSSSSDGTKASTGGTPGSAGDGSGPGATTIGTSGPSNSSDTTLTVCDGTTCTSTTKSTATAGAGTGTGATGSNGSSNTTTTTECAKAAASSASAPAGAATCTNTTTTTQPQAEFCKLNPKAAACVNSSSPSSFNGQCAGGFKAQSDDAVINAMAEETFRQNCKMNPDEASQADGKAASIKTGNLNGDNPNNATFAVGAGNFDTSDAIGSGGGCIADKSVTIAGRSVLLPLSSICPYLNALGLVLLACSFLLAARIVTRG